MWTTELYKIIIWIKNEQYIHEYIMQKTIKILMGILAVRYILTNRRMVSEKKLVFKKKIL